MICYYFVHRLKSIQWLAYGGILENISILKLLYNLFSIMFTLFDCVATSTTTWPNTVNINN